MSNISHCLWFDGNAEQAARFYTSVFKSGKLGPISRYGNEGFEIHGQPEGSVMTVEFELDGVKYLALNGGPLFRHSEAFSVIVSCESQAEIDYYWEKLASEGGQHVQCGWLKDKFGLSWQITPKVLEALMRDPDPKKRERVMHVVMESKKLEIEALERAYRGNGE